MKALVMGTGNGGRTIAECCLRQGWEVTVVDPDVSRDTAGNLTRRGASVRPSVPEDAFDICISRDGDLGPGTERVSYCGIVNRLFDPYDGRTRIEVTGSGPRSITCILLAHVLDTAGMRTYLNVQGVMGQYSGGRLVVTDVGGCDAQNLLVLPLTEYDVMVCEVSDGGSGRAAAQVLTGCAARDVPKYRSALGPGAAVPAELKDSFPGAEVLADVEGKDGTMRFEYTGERSVTLRTDVPREAVAAAVTVCRRLGVPADALCEGLESFKGFETRPPSFRGLLSGLRNGRGSARSRVEDPQYLPHTDIVTSEFRNDPEDGGTRFQYRN